MSPFAPVMLFGWVPFSILLFLFNKPHRALIVCIIGGWLFLPTAEYNFPGIPPYSKSTAIALGCILGNLFSGPKYRLPFTWKAVDIAMLSFCLCPIATSLSNNLGIYNGLSDSLQQTITWGVPFFMGRKYLNEPEALSDLCYGILIGGVIYAFLCLYEIRMSPRLNLNIYGFLPHAWRQHRRYGGWRPMVFMDHGLMVALWMASCSTISFWLWKTKFFKNIVGVPLSLISFLLILTTILCKSASGWLALFVGCSSYYAYMASKSRLLFLALLLVFPGYTSFRLSGLVSTEDIKLIAAGIFDQKRVESLDVRLSQEDPFINKAMKRPLFGWSGHSRGWPIDPYTGRVIVRYIDSLWLIVFSKFGFLGLTTLVFSMAGGPWMVLRRAASNTKTSNAYNQIVPLVLCLPVILFLIDCLANGMVNPIYIMVGGGLVGWAVHHDRNQIKQRMGCIYGQY